MLLRVQYHNNEYNYVSSSMLDKLIADEEISKFYRPSEKRWITPGIDPVRTVNPLAYEGLERRQSAATMEANAQAWLSVLSGTA